MKSQTSLPRPEIPFEEYDLENGLHVILAENHDVQLVGINLWYHVGSKDEDPDRSGFAHLFEHMMFQGSRNVPKLGHFKFIQAAGGTLNATTNQDRTVYFETLPSSHLAMGLWLESDRMMSLAVTEENFENQRAVVKEERRARYDNRPYGLVYETLVHYAFPESGYHWSTIGSMQHLNETEIDEVVKFHQRFYVPNNASLSIAGDFDPREAKLLVERYFGSIPRGAATSRPVQRIPKLTSQQRPELFDAGKLPSVTIAFQAAPAFSRDSYIFDAITSLLSAGKSSRLYNTLVYEKQVAKEISVDNVAFEATGLLVLDAMMQQGVSPECGEEALWIEIDRLITEPPSDVELTKMRNRNESMLIRAFSKIARRADFLQRAYTFTGQTARYGEALDILPTITQDDIVGVVKKYMQKDSSVVLTDYPKKP